MEPPTVRIEGGIDAAAVRRLVDALGASIAATLPERRWFGDKDRLVSGVSAAGAAVDRFGAAVFAWVALEVAFTDGGRAGYAYPLAVADAGTTEGPILARLDCPDRPRELLEATDHPVFPDWLLAALAEGRMLSGSAGRLAFSPLPALARRLAAARRGPARVGGLEQSNTAIRYGEDALIKLFRQLVPGVDLDEAVTRFLAERAGFANVPSPLGAAAWLPDVGDAIPAALAQAYVPNVGDGWSWILARFAEGTTAARDEATVAIRLLGERTGAMHRALAADPADPFFSPKPAAPRLVSAQRAASREALTAAIVALRRLEPTSSGEAARLVRHVVDREEDLSATLSGFAAEVGLPRIRVHGDYHLGQVLRTPGGDWTILDFEGEPARPLVERLAKASPLKDVAGMLSSLGYARAAAVAAGGDPAALTGWHATAREALLSGYVDAVSGAEPPLVPSDPAAFAAARAAWELDKTLYEIRYELANRPDWLPIPLTALAGLA